jgi:hypothetical protein
LLTSSSYLPIPLPKKSEANDFVDSLVNNLNL